MVIVCVFAGSAFPLFSVYSLTSGCSKLGRGPRTDRMLFTFTHFYIADSIIFMMSILIRMTMMIFSLIFLNYFQFYRLIGAWKGVMQAELQATNTQYYGWYMHIMIYMFPVVVRPPCST